MAVLHRAYTFDPMAFHHDLLHNVMDAGTVCDDRLRDLAHAAVATASATMRQALVMVRFDHEWLEPAEGEPWPTHWYIILLTSVLAAARSFTERFPLGWLVLQRVLPLAGWPEDAIDQVVRGQRLQTLVAASGSDALDAHVGGRGINQFGGWLSLPEVAALLARLSASEQVFTQPTEQVLEAVAPVAALRSADAAAILLSVYADARAMLETAVQRQQALFIVLD